MFHAKNTPGAHLIAAAVAAGESRYDALRLANGLAPEGTTCFCGCGLYAVIPRVSPFIPGLMDSPLQAAS